MTVVVLRDHYTCSTRQQMLHNATTVTKVKVQSRRGEIQDGSRTVRDAPQIDHDRSGQIVARSCHIKDRPRTFQDGPRPGRTGAKTAQGHFKPQLRESRMFSDTLESPTITASMPGQNS